MARAIYAATGSGAGRTDSVWYDCPWQQIRQDPSLGCLFEENFMSIPKTPPTTEGNWGVWSAFTSTGGTIIDGSTLGGAITIGSDDDNEGVGLRTLICPFKLIQGASNRFWMEWRVKTSTIADTKAGLFFGLMENTALTATSLMADDGTLADINFVGFHRLEGDGDYFDTVYKANGVTQVTVQSDAAVIAADTYQKLAMKLVPTGDKDGAYALSFYNNGTRLTSSKLLPSAAGTDFPNDVNLGLVCFIKNAAGSSPCTATLDSVYAAQLF